MMRLAGVVLTGLMLGAYALPSLAQTSSGIYSCVDAKGRKLTSDRPIRECADREQLLLNPSGTVRAVVPPSLTGPERAALEARQRREAEERARQAEEKRRERALLVRYPNRSVHDKERAEALSQITVVRQAALNRVKELQRQRKELDTELEFYAKDPDKVPPSLRRLVDDNEKSMSVQERFIADQDAEMVRVNARFDEELQRLQLLWAQIAAPAAN
ncbi:MAG: DUF4124 domain-containing protein [Hylemonella sp.]|uniref:DUF4124 domain-containing protein n=1 Tax=Hylemonella sp. TaxID=2066020 RepID=UPI0022CBDDF9|nr:DUF4124 domain-containing protein [Hylemonella sp.]MCZ8252732.1 DUF4124 domain-containing protein [Hylemonella sp.]